MLVVWGWRRYVASDGGIVGALLYDAGGAGDLPPVTLISLTAAFVVALVARGHGFVPESRASR